MRGKVGDLTFRIAIADTDEKRKIGLSTISRLPKDGAMMLKFDKPTKVPIRMSDMKFPIDLVFMKDNKVQKIVAANPGDDDITIDDKSDAVLEVSKGLGGKLNIGDSFEMLGTKHEDGTITPTEGGLEPSGKRQLLDEDGKIQANFDGNERVFSRKDTSKFYKYLESKDYKKLGKAFVEAMHRQDTQKDQYSKN